MSYTPPAGNAVLLRFSGSAYTPPVGNAVLLRFWDGGGTAAPSDLPPLVVPAGVIPRFRVTLTGAADSLPDIEIAARSWQGTRHNATRASYGGAVCDASQLPAITARPNGELVFDWGWEGSWQELLRVPLQTVRRDRGARADTLTLSGYATLAVPARYRAVLSGISRRHARNGKYRRWVAFDARIRPGHQIVDGATIYDADYLTYNAAPHSAALEVSQYQ